MSPAQRWLGAIAASDLPAITRLVARYLADEYMNRRTLETAPGAARLAMSSGLSERCVKTHLRLLVERGWLVQTKRGGKGKGVPSEYRGTIPDVWMSNGQPAP